MIAERQEPDPLWFHMASAAGWVMTLALAGWCLAEAYFFWVDWSR